jgi:hypothetical protein
VDERITPGPPVHFQVAAGADSDYCENMKNITVSVDDDTYSDFYSGYEKISKMLLGMIRSYTEK